MINQNHLILLYVGKRGDTGGEAKILGHNPARNFFY